MNARLEKNIKLYQDIQVAQKIDCDRLLEEKNKLFNAMVESKQKIEEGLQKQVNINESLEEQYRLVAPVWQPAFNYFLILLLTIF